jgi:hypothetical protein
MLIPDSPGRFVQDLTISGAHDAQCRPPEPLGCQKLLETNYRKFVLRYADMVEFQADGLERLALESMKAPPAVSLQERLRDAEVEREVAAAN